MILKRKSWLWYLTWPFAHDNCTTIGETVYRPRGYYPPNTTIAHEAIHIRQQAEVGVAKFIFLYLFCLPFRWNPWRWKWEWEAYREGSRWSEEQTRSMLRSYRYGWLRNE